MAEGLPKILAVPESQQVALGTGAEVVIPEDLVSAPATGAALWSRLKLEAGSYCEVEECFTPSASIYPVTWELPGEKDEL